VEFEASSVQEDLLLVSLAGLSLWGAVMQALKRLCQIAVMMSQTWVTCYLGTREFWNHKRKATFCHHSGVKEQQSEREP
jgi:hypothetical protein